VPSFSIKTYKKIWLALIGVPETFSVLQFQAIQITFVLPTTKDLNKIENFKLLY
jgi:hypothetical protein